MGKISIRALILDYGGVISQPQNPENVNNILRRLKQEPNGFREVYLRQRAQYDSGQLSGEQYWANILQHYGINPVGFDIAGLIRQDVKSWTQINEAMIQLITECRSKVHKLAIISNMTQDTLVLMRRQYHWLGLFDELCFSCELGITKPGREIFEMCLQNLKVRPNECLFVDDSERNVRGAMVTGMHTVLFKTFSEFMLELDEKFSFVM